jgi:hypothetical protein
VGGEGCNTEAQFAWNMTCHRYSSGVTFPHILWYTTVCIGGVHFRALQNSIKPPSVLFFAQTIAEYSTVECLSLSFSAVFYSIPLLMLRVNEGSIYLTLRLRIGWGFYLSIL